MIYKNLVIFSSIVIIICGVPLGYLAYTIPIEQQIAIKNQPLVKNCIPVGPDIEIPRKSIGNNTHLFDLRTCQWIDSQN